MVTLLQVSLGRGTLEWVHLRKICHKMTRNASDLKYATGIKDGIMDGCGVMISKPMRVLVEAY